MPGINNTTPQHWSSAGGDNKPRVGENGSRRDSFQQRNSKVGACQPVSIAVIHPGEALGGICARIDKHILSGHYRIKKQISVFLKTTDESLGADRNAWLLLLCNHAAFALRVEISEILPALVSR